MVPLGSFAVPKTTRSFKLYGYESKETLESKKKKILLFSFFLINFFYFLITFFFLNNSS